MLDQNKILSKKSFCQQNLGSEIFFGKNVFWSKKLLDQKNFWIKKIFDQKNFYVKKICGQKNFGQKDLGRKIFLEKNWVELTKGGGCMAPQPHPENSRVKFVCG